MPSSLPTENALSKMVDNFGIGPYDSPSNGNGENDEETTSPSLPGIPDMFEYEPYIGYPQAETPQAKHATFEQLIRKNPKLAVAILPNDPSAPARGAPRIEDDTIDSMVLSPTDITSNSELPSDADNPSARSDYYDRMQMGAAMSDMFAEHDQGAYVSNEESLPTPATNDMLVDDFLGALGNSDSGYIVEDQAVPYGHPSPDFQDDSLDYPKSNNEFVEVKAKVSTFEDLKHAPPLRTAAMKRTATDIEFVKELTKKFIKVHGKKDITRRAVTAFIQDEGHGDKQYIASDIVRCLKHEHDIVIPDVLDIFPVRSASQEIAKLSTIRDFLLDGEVYLLDKDIHASKDLGRCASNITEIIDLFKQHDGGPAITG